MSEFQTSPKLSNTIPPTFKVKKRNDIPVIIFLATVLLVILFITYKVLNNNDPDVSSTQTEEYVAPKRKVVGQLSFHNKGKDEGLKTFLESFNVPPSNNKVGQKLWECNPNPPSFKYLGVADTDLLGNREEAAKFISQFEDRYSWVKPLKAKYGIEIAISKNFLSEKRDCMLNYRKYLFDVDIVKNRKKYVARFLEGVCIADFLFAKGSLSDRELGIDVVSSIFRDLSFKSSKLRKIGKEMEIPAIIDVYWPILADHPDLLTSGNLSYATSVLNGCTDVEATRFEKWIIANDQLHDLVDIDAYKVSLYNRCIDFKALKYAFFILHTQGVMEHDLNAQNLLFKRIFPQTYKKELIKYKKLLSLYHGK